MSHDAARLRKDALAIWQAGVDAVSSERLVGGALQRVDNRLKIVDQELDLAAIDRVVVVGGGKAGAGMAAAVEAILGPELLREKNVDGWINVPANCVRPLEKIRLHAARVAGSNEPTPAGAAGSEEILRRVASLGPRDLCLCLISGGASALMPAPVPEITLADKRAVTQQLAAAGANIRELNTVRKQLSRIKGGGLARACAAGRLITLIISDVLGDPLDVIGSGPTVPDTGTPAEALAILERFQARERGVFLRVFDYLKSAGARPFAPTCQVNNYIIGNNADSVFAAAKKADQLGYACETSAATTLEGDAEPIGRALAEQAVALWGETGRHCVISGGEPVVRLAETAVRGLGGRNQQLVLAAAEAWWNDPPSGVVLLSGGTDGEDGPTDAAGAWCDVELLTQAKRQGLEPCDFLRRNDAYHFFAPLGGLVRTGPTHTNVCDLRVIVVESAAADV